MKSTGPRSTCKCECRGAGHGTGAGEIPAARDGMVVAGRPVGTVRVDARMLQAPGAQRELVGQLALLNLSHNLHYRAQDTSKPPLDEAAARKFAARYIDVILKEEPDTASVDVALERWRQMYPQDARTLSPAASAAPLPGAPGGSRGDIDTILRYEPGGRGILDAMGSFEQASTAREIQASHDLLVAQIRSRPATAKRLLRAAGHPAPDTPGWRALSTHVAELEDAEVRARDQDGRAREERLAMLAERYPDMPQAHPGDPSFPVVLRDGSRGVLVRSSRPGYLTVRWADGDWQPIPGGPALDTVSVGEARRRWPEAAAIADSSG